MYSACGLNVLAAIVRARPPIRWTWCSRSALGLLLICSIATSQTAATSSANATEFECVIEPQQLVKLASPVVGVIARLDVDRGDIVRKGQIVGKLEDGVEAAMLALARARATNESTIKAAEARLLFLRSKYGRQNELHGKAIASLAALEEAEAEVKVAEQQVKEAKLNRELAQLEVQHSEEVVNQRTLRSPIDGVVVERLLVPGEYRNEQTPILTLAQIDPLRVEVFVPTAHYGQIRTGSKAVVRPEQPIGGVYTATIIVVDHVLDAASGTFGVRLALPNPELQLPAGIGCKVSFEMLANERMPTLSVGSATTKSVQEISTIQDKFQMPANEKMSTPSVASATTQSVREITSIQDTTSATVNTKEETTYSANKTSVKIEVKQYSKLARIMHYAALFCMSGARTRANVPSGENGGKQLVMQRVRG